MEKSLREMFFTRGLSGLLVMFALSLLPTGAMAQSAGHKVTLKEGTTDAANWKAKAGDGDLKALPMEGVAEGATVTLQYGGRKRVMSVRATKKVVWDGDLSKLTGSEPEGFATATNGMTITGTLADGVNVKVMIADRAKVTLSDATILGTHVKEAAYYHAGITCLGDATIVLVGTNKVKGFYEDYPGIYVPEGKTLTISGDGSLDAKSNGYACGIGGGLEIECGNITIEGGSITATGGRNAAGIGGGGGNSCGDIRITGGTVEAKGGDNAAGIGSGFAASCGNISIEGGSITANGSEGAAGIGSGGALQASCGDILITGGTVEAKGGYGAAGIGGGCDAKCLDITITSGVTKVTATKGNSARYSIGNSEGNDDKCGTVTIGCTLDTDGNPVGGKEGMVRTSPYIYPEPIDLSTLTADYEAKNGATLTGTLGGNYKISIAEGATVTLSGAKINGVNDTKCEWAGLTCEGDATIVLVGTNTVKGFHKDYPGIYVPEYYTLTICGDGSLEASSNGRGCGIGGGLRIPCGDITIEGGSITATGGDSAAGIGGGGGGAASCGDISITGGKVKATGGDYAAGIGSGFGDESSCGNILITGGTVEAKGGDYAAGIGSGYTKNASCGNITITGGTVEAKGGELAAGIGSGYNNASCGDIRITGGTVVAEGGDGAAGIGSGFDAECLDITITSGVTKVTATKGISATYSIGKGKGSKASCGTVTIGCTLGTDGKPVAGTGTVYWDGSKFVNGGETYLSQSPLTYPEPKLGDLYYSDGTWSATLVAGKTPIGVIAYLGTDAFTETGTTVGGSTFTGHGLVLCLKNAASNVKWSTEYVSKFPGQEVDDVDALKRTTNVSGYTNTATLTVDAETAAKYPAAAAAKNYTGLAAPATGTTGWFLPSAQQWVRMMTGLGGLSEGDITWVSWFNNDHSAATAWETAMAKAGAKGTAYDSMTDVYLWYWPSSEYSANDAVYLDILATDTGTVYGFGWFIDGKDYSDADNRVRPVLAF